MRAWVFLYIFELRLVWRKIGKKMKQIDFRAAKKLSSEIRSSKARIQTVRFFKGIIGLIKYHVYFSQQKLRGSMYGFFVLFFFCANQSKK